MSLPRTNKYKVRNTYFHTFAVFNQIPFSEKGVDWRFSEKQGTPIPTLRTSRLNQS